MFNQHKEAVNLGGDERGTGAGDTGPDSTLAHAHGIWYDEPSLFVEVRSFVAKESLSFEAVIEVIQYQMSEDDGVYRVVCPSNT